MVSVKTNESLIQALEKAAKRKPTADELRQQRVSYVYGSVKSSNSLTKARIKDLLAEQLGS